MNYFKDFEIHKRILNQFQHAFENSKLAHAYLFYGPEGAGKEAVSLEVAKLLNCTDTDSHPCNKCLACTKINKLNHPDVHYVFPVSTKWKVDDIKKRIAEKAGNPFAAIDQSGVTNISIDRIRELKNEAKYPPYESKQKVYIITDADKMNRESANSFLKLLEEPPDYLTLILITSSKNALLDTIRSRCRSIYFPLLSEEEISGIVKIFHPLDDKIKKVIRFSRGNLKKVFSTFEEDFSEKQNLVLAYLRAAATGSAQKISTVVDDMYRKRDKNYLMEILNLIILWFQDVIHVVHLENEARIISTDHVEELKKFAKVYSHSNFEKIINYIEEAIQNISRNVHAPLLLTVLALKIKKTLVKSTKELSPPKAFGGN
jgi:DNA polymerase-3 subunit delta'